MAVIQFFRRRSEIPSALSDDALLPYFETHPEQAWDQFIARYADEILATLRRLGFDHDEAMDRFVYICEKLCEQRFRRLRGIRHTGERGELTPWVRAVVKNLSVNWAWSVDGRRRLFKSIAELPQRERRVFELYFWGGLSASEVHQQLCLEEDPELSLLDVLDALEGVFAHLTAQQRWRLMSQLLRHRDPVPIAAPEGDTPGFEPASGQADPEAALLQRERRQQVVEALDGLPARDRLILQLRYDEALTLKEVAEIMSLSLSTVKGSLRSSLDQLRHVLESVTTPGEEGPCPA